MPVSFAARVEHRPDGEGLKQPAPGDVLGELLDRDAGLDRGGHSPALSTSLLKGMSREAVSVIFWMAVAMGFSATGRPRASLSPLNPSRSSALSSSSSGGRAGEAWARGTRAHRLRSRRSIEALRPALEVETRILVRLGAREGRDALHEIEHARRRAALFGEHGLDDLGSSRPWRSRACAGSRCGPRRCGRRSRARAARMPATNRGRATSPQSSPAPARLHGRSARRRIWSAGS